jgi:NAD(P)-dependent dehydrogenase (short-subunit alcohol dehydrogenase family)
MMRQLSINSENTIIGLVRDKSATDKKVSEELSERSNIHILEGELTDYDGLVKAVAQVAEISGGIVDYLVSNAAFPSHFDAFSPIGPL